MFGMGGQALSLFKELDLVCHQLCLELKHEYVQTVLPKPDIDRDKLTIYYMLFRMNEPQQAAGSYTKSVMVAEIGLNTHETMTCEKRTNKELLKQRQLTVLSGDFYSALYYYTLARQSNIELVKWVAQAIQNFNEYKCALFFPPVHFGWQELIHEIKKIESALVGKIARQLGFTHVVPYISDFFLIKRLIAERDLRNEEKHTGYFSKMRLDDDDQLVEKLDSEIKNRTAQLSQALKRSEDQSELFLKLKDYINLKLPLTA